MLLNHRTLTPHLILGAARSGKSSYAEALIGSFDSPYVYIATAQILDAEMEERVKRHRLRRTDRWRTIECPIALVQTLSELRSSGSPVLVDCLTLWLTNLLLASPEPDPEHALTLLVDLLPHLDYPLLIVSNEVGAGIVPENALARRFRDLAGLANQRVAAACRAATLVVAGLPIELK